MKWILPYFVRIGVELYTYGTKIVVKGGFDTAAGAINVRNGDQLSLGFFADDTDGSFAIMDFTLFVNGDVNPSVIIQGSGPFYQILWAPPDDRGDYNLEKNLRFRWSKVDLVNRC